jgi:DNA (cytosine-5)-methyltransferase 1
MAEQRQTGDNDAGVSYPKMLSQRLRPADNGSPFVLDLFAGCGGLALGFEAAGFATHGFEMDADCVATYRANLSGECTETVLTPKSELPEAQVIIGGPPCQPFSVGGAQKGHKDERDGFPAFLAAVRRLSPELALIENVRGMLYRNRPYLKRIQAALKAMGYEVDVELLNARDHGVPQNRKRVIIVAHHGGWKWPEREPGPPATAGMAVGDTAYQAPDGSKFLTPSMDRYIADYEAKSKCIRPRDLHLDRPARTLTCRNLAGATSDMHRIQLPDGRRRRLLVREAARLQSFPDWFEFSGGETSALYQIGNAVAPLFALSLAASVRGHLSSREKSDTGQSDTEPVAVAA